MKVRFKNKTESTRYVAQQNENYGKYSVAAKLYREIGDTAAAERCENTCADCGCVRKQRWGTDIFDCGCNPHDA